MGPSLRHQVLLVPDLPDPPKFRKSVRALDRPMISIVITDLGESSADKLLSIPIPVTVAIRPYTRVGSDGNGNGDRNRKKLVCRGFAQICNDDRYHGTIECPD